MSLSTDDVVPHRNDVLMGRGTAINEHPGNLRFRSLVDAQRTKFQQEKVRKAKRAIAHGIIDEIRDLQPPGRFLAERSGGEGVASAPDGAMDGSAGEGVDWQILCRAWVQADDDVALKKTMHRLREKGGRKEKRKEALACGSGDVQLDPLRAGGQSIESDGLENKKDGEESHMKEGKASPPPADGPTQQLQSDESKGDDDSFFDGIPEWPGGSMEQQEWDEWESSLLGEELRVDPYQNGGAAPAGPLGHRPDAFDGFSQSLLESIPNGEGAGAALKSDDPAIDQTSQMRTSVGDSIAPNASPVDLLGTEPEERVTAYDMVLMAAGGKRMSIQEWMDATSVAPSNSIYVESAVDLACMLTQHLCQLIGETDAKLEEHMATGDIMIFVEHQMLPGSRPPPIVGIKLKFEQSDHLKPHLTGRSAGGATPSRHRAVCAALGRVLLQIFSRGSISTTSQQTSSIEEEALRRQGAAKRKMTTSTASVAKNLAASGAPLSICRLVRDLLRADHDPCPRTAIASLDEALMDLRCMKANPQTFLFDRTCPKRALDEARLYERTETSLFGREDEIRTLMTVKNKVSAHVHNVDGNSCNAASNEGSSFLCETVFLRGYPGSGKSSLLHSLVSRCNEEQWFVVECKFDNQAVSPMTFMAALNEFFGKWGRPEMGAAFPVMAASFQSICQRILRSVDEDGFDHLSDVLPNFTRLYPARLTSSNGRRDQRGISSNDKVGSGTARIRNLIHVIVQSLCTAGRPVLLIFDDLQWADSDFHSGFTDFIVNCIPSASSIIGDASRGGLFVAGSFRSNEVSEGDDLMKSINAIRESGRANVTMLDVDDFSQADVNQLLSSKLCLPPRYTRELAAVVHAKTRGNPFHIVQFLRAITQNKMLEFSVKSRRWMWDCDVVDMQMISEGVAELLTSTFSKLSPMLIKTLQIVSCLGFQVESVTIEALDSTNRLLSFNMMDQMGLAVEEGILEKAGPVYQFTHDLVKQSIYESLPSSSRCLLHKTIGKYLLSSAEDNQTIYLLAVDQINQFCSGGGAPSPEERIQFASCNAQAAKYASAASRFSTARPYIEAGRKLLVLNDWETHYALSLELFNMSASACWMNGDTATMAERLDAIIEHAKSFDDGLPASCLLAKLLASTSNFEAATKNCLIILSKLGVAVSPEVTLPLVQNELHAMNATLRNISLNQMRQLPPMTDRRKLNALKVLNMLCSFCVVAKPLMLPVLSCRMVSLTLQHGFCEDSIVGIATAGYSVLLFGDDVQLAINLGRVSQALIQESPNKHVMRARLCHELTWALRSVTEPMQSVVALFPDLYSSAMLAGDVENAAICRLGYCGGLYVIGANLDDVAKHCELCIKESAHYQQTSILYLANTFLNACLYLTGKTANSGIPLMSFDELNDIGERSMPILHWNIFVHLISLHFWMGEYHKVAELSVQYSTQYPHSPQKRTLHVIRSFYESIAFLTLARNSNSARYRALGEQGVKYLALLCDVSKWNNEHKSLLLQAELCYVNGDFQSAETKYNASIKAARQHKFAHEEGLAYERYGVFCMENGMIEKGRVQLQSALAKYKEWGATEVVKRLQLYIDSITNQ